MKLINFCSIMGQHTKRSVLERENNAVQESKVKEPAQEIQFFRIKWQDGHRHLPMDMINKITAVFSEKGTQPFLGGVGFWIMCVPE